MLQAAAESVLPPPRLAVTEWAEKHRFVSSERTAKPGFFRAWPFQREPMDELSPHSPTEFIILMCAAQMLKTTAIENAIGCAIDQDPGPILLIQPRDADAEEFSKSSIDPMFRDTDCLRRKVVEKKSRDTGNTIFQKRFVGGSLTMLGAQTPENFMMRSIRYAFGDEVDRWPRELVEGSTVGLFITRTQNFRGTRKVVLASTPTLAGSSTIADWFAKSDQRRFHVPCPFCEYEQVLRWDRVTWGEEIAPADAHYRCESCGVLIPEWRKAWMLERGRWIAGRPESRIAGFHLPRLYSPITPWGELAEEFLDAQNRPAEMQKFVNTKLAEVWEGRGEAPDWEKIKARSERYEPATVPPGALFLTAGVDVQGDRIEVYVWGWARARERWLVDHLVLPGNTADLKSSAWTSLTEAVERTYPHPSGVHLPIVRIGIDSGHHTQQVYEWARPYGAPRVLVMKGRDSGVALLAQPLATQQSQQGRKLRRGLGVRMLNVSMAKDELYKYLRMTPPEAGQPYPAGWVHTYLTEDEFYRQLVAEQYVERTVKGRIRGEWVKIRERNEALDCANMARGAYEQFTSGFTERHWRRLERDLMGSRQPVPDPPAAPAAPPPPPPEPAPAAEPPPKVVQKPRRRPRVGFRISL